MFKHFVCFSTLQANKMLDFIMSFKVCDVLICSKSTTLRNYIIHIAAIYKTSLEKNFHCFDLVNIEVFDDHFHRD